MRDEVAAEQKELYAEDRSELLIAFVAMALSGAVVGFLFGFLIGRWM